ncbi:hypothetical protein PFY01_09245 [Brevundimonas vesicularis]|uniref:hypothetical protein n=1 Tax=Brevundimonas vesicularis TaxID=41276 RepID=UPI0022EC2A37|nr:hypothetical protein [Brevundimonas vesicularis]WBT04839.1 hypothetical protein PFY01_08800 [Brevundimonas vesicularis]WBT04926.1 hypothetical protein PFY01_09245 [Brevundimonas vesicularis]
MCDFKPGDEVQVIAVGPKSGRFIAVGQIHTIREVSLLVDGEGQNYANMHGETVGVKLVGIKAWKPNSVHTDGHFSPRLFRKLQRRDLSAWLKTATDFEEPTRAPVVEPA